MKNSIWDKMKGFATPYAADDNYDDEMDDELDDGFPDEEPAAPRFSRSGAFSSDAGTTSDFTAAPKTEPLGDSFGSTAASSPSNFDNTNSFSNSGFTGHVMNSTTGAKQQMVLFQPQSFNEISGIAQNLRIKKAIVLNLEGVDHNLAMRCVDFLSGCAFAVDGTVKKVAASIYVFCPNNMEVVGELPSMQVDLDSII